MGEKVKYTNMFREDPAAQVKKVTLCLPRLEYAIK